MCFTFLPQKPRLEKINKISIFPSLFLYLFLVGFFPQTGHAKFIGNRPSLTPYYDKENVVMISSSGRSGSTMLTQAVKKCSKGRFLILKSHLLPPDNRFKGKILFIFSNPDQAAESVLYRTLKSQSFGSLHFRHMESSDYEWLKKIENTTLQNEEENLLAYDALGCKKQLSQWLLSLKSTSQKNAQVLAIKYENLWEPETVQAIKTFLGINDFKLPAQRERGYADEVLSDKDLLFRKIYNKGTKDKPRYIAYDEARAIWEKAKPFKFYQL